MKPNPKSHFKFKAIAVISAFTVSLSFSHLALASPQKVDKAVANLTNHTVTITGSNFAAPTVTLDNINLTITSSSATSIVATLPGSITPGSYHLIVTVGGSGVDLDVTLGDTGPTGPTGATGSTGPTGATGATG